MAYPKFKAGELVITQHATFFTELDGSLGVVVQPLERRLCKDLNSMKRVYAHVYGVKVLAKENLYLWFRPWQLRKLGADEILDTRQTRQKSGRNLPRRKKQAHA